MQMKINDLKADPAQAKERKKALQSWTPSTVYLECHNINHQRFLKITKKRFNGPCNTRMKIRVTKKIYMALIIQGPTYCYKK